MSAAPAYVSTPPDVISLSALGLVITQTPQLVSSQGTLNSLQQAAAKAGTSLLLSPAASGKPQTGR